MIDGNAISLPPSAIENLEVGSPEIPLDEICDTDDEQEVPREKNDVLKPGNGIGDKTLVAWPI